MVEDEKFRPVLPGDRIATMKRFSAMGAAVVLALALPAHAKDGLQRVGPLGDRPAGPQSLPGDALPPFNILDAEGVLVPMPPDFLRPHDAKPLAAPPIPGPDLEAALRMARAAIAACAAKGALVGVTVIDSVGEARAMLSADGAPGSYVFVAHRKALTTLEFAMPSLHANQEIWAGKLDKARVSPQMFVMGGAVPIFDEGELIGAIAVSGAAGGPPPGSSDEACARAGLAAL